jgi:hypothetical protein
MVKPGSGGGEDSMLPMLAPALITAGTGIIGGILERNQKNKEAKEARQGAAQALAGYLTRQQALNKERLLGDISSGQSGMAQALAEGLGYSKYASGWGKPQGEGQPSFDYATRVRMADAGLDPANLPDPSTGTAGVFANDKSTVGKVNTGKMNADQLARKVGITTKVFAAGPLKGKKAVWMGNGWKPIEDEPATQPATAAPETQFA